MKEIKLKKGDQLEFLPETEELKLGCCNCGAIHNYKVIHGKNLRLEVGRMELPKVTPEGDKR